MTDLRQAAMQALEALDTLYRSLSPESVLAADLKRRADALRAALEQPQQEQSVRNTDELPSGFVSLQQENGRVVYAACMDRDARHYKWLMWKHPDGRWVSKRKLENWEVMQVEDQEHYGIVQEAAHGIKEET